MRSPCSKPTFWASKPEPLIVRIGNQLLDAYTKAVNPDMPESIAKFTTLMQTLRTDARNKLLRDSSELAGQVAVFCHMLLTLKACNEAEPGNGHDAKAAEWKDSSKPRHRRRPRSDRRDPRAPSESQVQSGLHQRNRPWRTRQGRFNRGWIAVIEQGSAAHAASARDWTDRLVLWWRRAAEMHCVEFPKVWPHRD